MSSRRRSRNRTSRGGPSPGAQRTSSGGAAGRPQAGSASHDGNSAGAKRGQPKQGGKGAGGRKRPSGRRPRKSSQPAGPSFWGDASKLPKSHPDIQITDDPSAVPRSLGTPPLPGHEAIAAHYFTAVYDRAVATAGALAAAGGLIDAEALIDDPGN